MPLVLPRSLGLLTSLVPSILKWAWSSSLIRSEEVLWFRAGSRSLEKSNALPKVTQLVSGGAAIQKQSGSRIQGFGPYARLPSMDYTQWYALHLLFGKHGASIGLKIRVHGICKHPYPYYNQKWLKKRYIHQMCSVSRFHLVVNFFIVVSLGKNVYSNVN